MRVVRLKISNFRGIKTANLHFTNHTVLVGDNNVGKSTIFEALNLVLGPDRLSRNGAINEHDFFGSQYIDSEKNIIPISIEVVVSFLSEEQKRHFQSNLEFWDNDTKEIVKDPPIEKIDDNNIHEALRVCFEGKYNIEEDDFEGNTYYSSPEIEDGPRSVFWKTDKRRCGFLYLRALRTGSRALSMERGSLLDVILRLRELRPQMWEETISQLKSIKVAENPALGLNDLLESIQTALQEYVPQDWGAAPHLKVSNLTRENLRKSLTVFMGTGIEIDNKPHFVPYYQLGTGTINMLVLSLLSIIADEKSSVIFAMEEPETSIPPYAQKRIIEATRKKSSQTFYTTHSPYVLEEFEPKDILVLQRDKNGILSGIPFSYPPIIKPKAYSLEFRKRFAEALLSRRVLIAEGKTEALAYPTAARKLALLKPNLYHSLESLGIAVFDAETDSQIGVCGELFKGLGKRVYSVFDKQNTEEDSGNISKQVDIAFEAPTKGFEDLILTQTKESGLRKFADHLIKTSGWPRHLDAKKPTASTSLVDLKKILKEVLRKNKGRGDASELLWQCTIEEMPDFIKETILKLTQDVYPPSE